MALPCVALRTEERDYFPFHQGYEGITNSELETLLEQGRGTVLSLEAELEKRHIATKLESSSGVNECSEKLRKSAGDLKVLGRLDNRAAGLAVAAVETLTTKQINRGSEIYQAFLCDILRHCGRGLVLLCAASLGKQRVISLNSRDRIGFVHYLKSSKAAFESPVLDLLAEEYQIPDENEVYNRNTNNSFGTLTRKRQLSEVTEQDSSQGNHPRRRRDETKHPEARIPSITQDGDGQDQNTSETSELSGLPTARQNGTETDPENQRKDQGPDAGGE